MVRIIITAKDPSESETKSLDVVAKVFENKNWTIVLRDPSGSTGGTGGDTSDIAIYASISEDYEDNNPIKDYDVYTPQKQTNITSIAAKVRDKLSNQTDHVCLDLFKNKNDAFSIHKKIKKMLKEFNLKDSEVIIHNNGNKIHVVSINEIKEINNSPS